MEMEVIEDMVPKGVELTGGVAAEDVEASKEYSGTPAVGRGARKRDEVEDAEFDLDACGWALRNPLAEPLLEARSPSGGLDSNELTLEFG
jgi:hypothetical protein